MGQSDSVEEERTETYGIKFGNHYVNKIRKRFQFNIIKIYPYLLDAEATYKVYDINKLLEIYDQLEIGTLKLNMDEESDNEPTYNFSEKAIAKEIITVLVERRVLKKWPPNDTSLVNYFYPSLPLEELILSNTYSKKDMLAICDRLLFTKPKERIMTKKALVEHILLNLTDRNLISVRKEREPIEIYNKEDTEEYSKEKDTEEYSKEKDTEE